MTTLEIVLLIALILVSALYLFSKFSRDKSFNEVIKEIKEDVKNTATQITEIGVKTKELVFDEAVNKKIREFILIVEENNKIAKEKGEKYLSGDEKKLEVVNKVTEWISSLTGNTTKALDFIEKYKSAIEKIIDEYVSFSNKMDQKVE